MSKESHLLRNTHAIKGLKQFQDSVVLSAETPLRHMLSSEAGEGVTYQYAGISNGMVRFSVAVPIPEVDLRKVQQYDALKKVISEILNSIRAHLIWFTYNPDSQEEEARKISIQALYGYYNHIAFFAPDFTKEGVLQSVMADIWVYSRGYVENDRLLDRPENVIRPFVKRVAGKALGAEYSKFISSVWRSHVLPVVTENTRKDINSVLRQLSWSTDPRTDANSFLLNNVGLDGNGIPEALQKTLSPQGISILTDPPGDEINFHRDPEGYCYIRSDAVDQILTELLPEEGYAPRPTLQTLIALVQKLRILAGKISHEEASWRFFFILTLIYKGIEVPSTLYSDTRLFD